MKEQGASMHEMKQQATQGAPTKQAAYKQQADQ